MDLLHILIAAGVLGIVLGAILEAHMTIRNIDHGGRLTSRLAVIEHIRQHHHRKIAEDLERARKRAERQGRKHT